MQRRTFKMSTTSTAPLQPVKSNGVGFCATVILIVGEMAGGGVVALPDAIRNTGWSGIAVLVIMAVGAAFTGAQLGASRTMLMEKYPEAYAKEQRKPYADIAGRALGNWGRHIASAVVLLSQFGVSIVFLLLGSENIYEIATKDFGLNHSISFCWIILIIAAFLFPLTLLGTPKDFWYVAIISLVSTLIACVLLTVGAIVDANGVVINGTIPLPEVNHEAPDVSSFALGFSTMAFAYGGHSMFPTLQADMRKPHQFWKASILGFSCLLALYLPPSVTGYAVYGSTLKGNVIQNIGTLWIRTGVSLLITIHVIFSFVILINPVSQELEELLRVPHRFCWQRVLTRLFLVVLVVFVCESVPHFGVILDLIGAVVVPLGSYILPGVIFVTLRRKLSSSTTSWNSHTSKPASFLKTEILETSQRVDGVELVPEPENKPRKIDWNIVFTCIICLVGIVGSVCGTIFAVRQLLVTGLSAPCYLNWQSARNSSNSTIN